MKRLLLETSFSKIYMIVMVIITLLILGGYFSYAMFTVSKEKGNAISIVTGNLDYELLVDGEESNKLVVGANTTKEFTITLSNINNRKARFNFYYIGELPLGVEAGYVTGSGINVPPEEIGTNLEKVDTSGSSNIYKIIVDNNSNNEITINLGVGVGLDYNDLSLKENQHLFEKSNFIWNVLLENGMGSNGDYYDDGTDTFMTGEDPNNYIWYSGKLWRAVSVNNEEKTTKLVTQWNISSIYYSDGHSAFKGSYMEEWLNDTTVDGFLANLRDPENFIVMDSKWDATMDDRDLGSITRPNGTTIVTDSVGLLNAYEYQTSYYGTTYSNGYLNNGLYWFTLTLYSLQQSSTVKSDGNIYSSIINSYPFGIRPSINIKSDIKIADGDGTEDNPYRLEGDHDINLNGTPLNTRYSGEYIRFGNDENNLYRIVSHETPGLTKITSAIPLKNNGEYIENAFGLIGSTTDDEANYLNNYVNSDYIDMIEENTTWYLGIVVAKRGGLDASYKLAKYADISMSSTVSTTVNAKVRLLRFGELMAGQFDVKENNTNYVLFTSSSNSFVPLGSWMINSDNGVIPSSSGGVKPSLNLKSNVVITGGDGTKNNPFTLS